MSLVSKPLLAGLLATAVTSVLMLLQPEISLIQQGHDQSLLAEPRSSTLSVPEGLQPWVRQPRLLPAVHPEQGLARSSVPMKPVLVVPPPPPPKPVAPQPAFTYLGRMLRDGQTYVFLGYGDEVEVVSVGATIGGNWRVDGVTDSGIELNYLPLNESRQLAMSER